MTFVAKWASTVLPIAAAAALAIGMAAPAAAATVHGKAPTHHAGRALYDAAPQNRAQSRAPVNSDDPALTGGGSLGYNQNIYNW